MTFLGMRIGLISIRVFINKGEVSLENGEKSTPIAAVLCYVLRECSRNHKSNYRLCSVDGRWTNSAEHKRWIQPQRVWFQHLSHNPGWICPVADSSSTSASPINAGSYDISTDGSAFSFSETATYGDAPVTSQGTICSTTGKVLTPNLYGDSTQYQGGTAGNLAGSLSATGVPTVTAGGAGTTAIGQRTIELSVFQ